MHKGLMTIERGNEGQGEAITYILNPECLASGKLIYHKNLVYHYWEKAGTEAKEHFETVLRQQEAKFSAEFQIEDVTLRGSVEPQAKIIRKGKEINQTKKKGASAGHTDTEQDTTSPTSHINYNREEEDNSTPFTDNMQKNSSLLTESEEKMFSGTLSRPSYENDPEIPFN